MNELSGALAYVQIGRLSAIVDHMRHSRDRIKSLISDTPGIGFRRLVDPEGSTGPFIILTLANEAKALDTVARMKDGGLHNVFRIAEYGLHIYSNITPLVQKVPLSPAGNPWNLAANKAASYDYSQGACPASDALFARSVLIPIPSRLTPATGGRGGVVVIKKAVG